MTRTADPGQEDPADLRLVAPALAAWATTALLLTAPGRWAAAVAAVCALAGAGLLVAGRPARTRPEGARGTARSATHDPHPAPHGTPHSASHGTPHSAPHGTRHPRASEPRTWRSPSAALLLLCTAAAAAASAGLHGADLRRGPVPELAARYARVDAEVEITSAPRPTRPRVSGDHVAQAAVLVEADVVRLTAPDGTVYRTRTPVLVIADAPRAAAGDRNADRNADRNSDRSAGPRGSPWLSRLPTTRLRVAGSLAPPLNDGDRAAAVLRVGPGERPREVGAPSGPQRLAGVLRAGLRRATDGLPADARALLPGLVVGDTARVTPELHAAFEATDLLHLTAVSGANFTILLALLIGPPGTAHLVERRGLAPRVGLSLRTTAVLGGGLTLGFVVVCGPEPSVLRAASCGLIALLAIATGRRRSLIPALATAVLLLVLYDPWLARSYGFLLSVLATGALLTLAPRWSAALRGRGVPGRLAEALGAAAAAQAVCAPVVAVLAARVSLVAVPCNLLAEFAVAPATVLGFAALVAAPVAMPVATFCAWCASWPAGWIAGIARTGAALPGSGVDWPGGWRGGALLAVGTAVLVVVGRRVLKSAWICGACALLLLLVVVQPASLTRVITGWPPPGWRLVMCDVGQGDALVLAAGAGAGIVVDAGPDPLRVDRCLRSLGITRIPLVLLTHFHADHVAGLPGVLRGRSVGAIETTGFAEPADQAAFVRRLAAARGLPMVRAVAGERRGSGPLDWQVLWPPPRPAPDPDGPNDASVTLLVRTGGLTLLLLGDLEPAAQRALARSAAGAGLSRVDVLKVAHHGSAYQDPGLLRRLAPRLALISVGADNPYGHPAPRTMAVLRAQGAAVLRTDRDGAVAVVSAGRGGAGLEVAHSGP
ncbi:ComEC/Rec2 family competence protein [Streptomyces sp. NPDC057694]|uniref:ComEC/Rec2 family competence protein n=1 Tax=Streptomyces sp. NPDC057694 TaxID=3346216 RepID=UPI0036A53A1D